MFNRRRKSIPPRSSCELRHSSSLNTMTTSGFSAFGPNQGTAPPRPLGSAITSQPLPTRSKQADRKLLAGLPRTNPEATSTQQTPQQVSAPETPKRLTNQSAFRVAAGRVPGSASPSMNRSANRFFGELQLPKGKTRALSPVGEDTRTPNKARRRSANTATMAGMTNEDVVIWNSTRKVKADIERQASEPATSPTLERPPGLPVGGCKRDQALEKDVNADQKRNSEMETPVLEKDGRLRRLFRRTDSEAPKLLQIDHLHLGDNTHGYPSTPSHRTEHLLNKRPSSKDGVPGSQHEWPLPYTGNLVSNPIQKSHFNSQRAYPPGQLARNPASRQRMVHSVTAPANPLCNGPQPQAKPLLSQEAVDVAHILHGPVHGQVIDDEMVAWAKRLGLAVDGTTGPSPKPRAPAVQAATRANDRVAFYGTPPRLWDTFHKAGIWSTIFKHVSKPDLCQLARVCRYAKSVAESHLYAELSFSPKFPHNCSFFVLGQQLVACLKYSLNNAKYAAYTKHIVISAGWTQNSWVIMEEERDGGLDGLGKGGSERLLGRAVREADGGVRELNMGLQLLVSRCLRLESLVWLSPIPMNTFLTASKLAHRSSLSTLHINLAQPTPLGSIETSEDERATNTGFQTYSPAFSGLGSVLLVNLSLTELPALTYQIHSLLKSVANTLRYLTLESTDRGPRETFTPLAAGLRLHTLRLNRIQFEPRGLQPTIENLTLHGQSDNIVLPTDMAAGILQFTTDSWTCLDAAVAIARIGKKKDIAFVPQAPRLGGISLNPLLAEYRHLQKLEFSKQCTITSETLELFSLSACAVQWLTIPVKIDQWTTFLPVSVNLRCLKYIGLYLIHDGASPCTDASGPTDDSESGHLRALRPAHFAEQLVEAFDDSGAASLRKIMIDGFEWKVFVRKLIRSNQTPAPRLIRFRPDAPKIVPKDKVHVIEVSRERRRHRIL